MDQIARRYEWEGAEDGELRWRTPSWTQPGVWYMVYLTPHDLVIHCDCMDYVCRKKELYLFDDSGAGCKHGRGLAISILRPAIKRDPGLIKAIMEMAE